jgi:Rrf2 family protein
VTVEQPQKKEEKKLIITREVDYALRILRALADGKRVTAKTICDRELLPLHFAYRILKKLEKGGLVQIARGADGGIRLCADLKSVSMYDLLSMIEENRVISACMQPDFECAWRRDNAGACMVHKQLSEVQRVLDEEFRKRSLEKMLFGER